MPKIAILSDVHSNLEALEAVLMAADAEKVDATYCLGDVVGYGASAADVVDIVRSYCDGVVRGNHEEAVAMQRGLDVLPPGGADAARQNRAELSDEQLEYLAGLPLKIEIDDMTLVHATPDQPAAWRRLGSFTAMREQFRAFETPVCFVGHTHIPGLVAERLGVARMRPGTRFLVNVGSVGRPRDHDPRACLGIFDSDAFDYKLLRIPYNCEAAARKVERAGLPPRLAEQLVRGS